MKKYLVQLVLVTLCVLFNSKLFAVELTGFNVNSNLNANSTVQQKFQNLTPAQQQILQQELQKQGGTLTPEAIKALKNKPEFKDIAPSEIEEGKKLLEELEKSPEARIASVPRTNATLSATSRQDQNSSQEQITSLFREYLLNRTGELKVNTRLIPFGYNIFQRGPYTPIPAQPVAPDYIIGPGDEIQVLVWGRINNQYNLRVGADGRIMFPQIGPLTVAGMRYDQMQDFLAKQVKRIAGTDVAITLSKLHQIQVFVLGEVQKPGPYNLTAMSTILDGLIAAGGPTGRGTLRNISLKRGGRVISVLDIYDLLLKGDKSKDKRLRNGDIIFVPLAGPLVGMAGNLRRPGIYELKPGTSLASAINLAGGLTPIAWKQIIQVERAENNAWKKVVDINARKTNKLKQFILRDGDLIKIFPILSGAANKIQLFGNVRRPGTYAFHPGMKLSEIIKSPDILLPDTYFDYALIKRFTLPEGTTELVPFNLGTVVLSKETDIQLHPLDKIYIFSRWFFEPRPTVAIKGRVRKPGTYQIPEKGFRVKDVILQAGGLARDAFLDKAELYRINKTTRSKSLLCFNLQKALANDPEHNLLLKDQDEIIIHSIKEYIPAQNATIYGEVNKPGTYPYVKGMRVKDLIFAAGNLKDSAYLKEAEIFSYRVINGTLADYSHKTINLELAMQDDPRHNILLKPYDKIFIKKISDWGREQYVELTGEVVFPGRYLIKKGEKLSSVIARAGGFTRNAYLRGAVFTREKVRKLQQQRLNEMVDRLERELLTTSSARTTTALSADEAKIMAQEAKTKEEIIKKLRQVKARGRLVIDLRPLAEFKQLPDDIELEQGDKLYVPANPGTVQVIGSVYNQTAFIYRPGQKISYYIEQAGGYSQNADKESIYILKADGSAVRPHKGLTWGFSWNSRLNRWEKTHRLEIEPGDTIVVPEKLERIAWMRNIKDISQILYQMAVTTGVVMTTLF